MAYDDDNIFAKILRGEIPNKTVAETEQTLAFEDIQPKRPVHVLAIPKGKYVDFADFARNASDAEILDYVRTLGRIAEDQGVTEGGFRLISNAGANGHQEVPHFHTHLLGGASVGPMVKPQE